MLTVTAKLNGSIYSLEQRLLVDTSDDKVALVNSLRTLCRCTDADSREKVVGQLRWLFDEKTAKQVLEGR